MAENENNNLPATQKKEAAPMPILKVGSKGYLVPDTLDTQWKMASIIATSGLAPKGMERTATLFTAIQLGAEVGLAPMQAVQSIAVINGRPTIWGDAQIALVKAHPEFEWIKERITGSGPNMVASCEVKRRTDVISVEQTFSVEDAKLAGLWGKAGPWKQYPKRMLQMRARSFALRDCFPDVLKGLSLTREEAIEMEEIKPGTYAAPEAQEVNEAITAAKTEKKKEPAKPAAEPKPAPTEKPAAGIQTSDTWDRDNWIKLRSTGFKPFVLDNLDELWDQEHDLVTDVKAKWYNLYKGEPFPVREIEEREEEILEPDPDEPSGMEPEEDADWVCGECNWMNMARSAACLKCGSVRRGAEQEAPPDPFTSGDNPADTDEPRRVPCPNRNDDPMFADYCNDECKSRANCPAWEAVDNP